MACELDVVQEEPLPPRHRGHRSARRAREAGMPCRVQRAGSRRGFRQAGRAGLMGWFRSLCAFLCLVGGAELLVVIAEVYDSAAEPLPAVASTACAAVSSNHGVRPAAVVLLKPRTIPKARAADELRMFTCWTLLCAQTKSGKIARRWCRKAYMDGTLDVSKRVPCTSLRYLLSQLTAGCLLS